MATMNITTVRHTYAQSWNGEALITKELCSKVVDTERVAFAQADDCVAWLRAKAAQEREVNTSMLRKAWFQAGRKRPDEIRYLEFDFQLEDVEGGLVIWPDKKDVFSQVSVPAEEFLRDMGWL